MCCLASIIDVVYFNTECISLGLWKWLCQYHVNVKGCALLVQIDEINNDTNPYFVAYFSLDTLIFSVVDFNQTLISHGLWKWHCQFHVNINLSLGSINIHDIDTYYFVAHISPSKMRLIFGKRRGNGRKSTWLVGGNVGGAKYYTWQAQ